MNKLSIKKVQISELDLSLIGSRINYVRQACGLKQSQFCDIVQISKGNLSDLENNRYKPSYQAISKIIEYFNVDPKWLLFGTGNPFNAESEFFTSEVASVCMRKDGSGDITSEAPIVESILRDISLVGEINPVAVTEIKDYVRFKLKNEISKNDRRTIERRVALAPGKIPYGVDRRVTVDRRSQAILSWR